MSGLSLTPLDPQPAPEGGWRSDERLLATWVRSHGGSELLASVAAWLRRAESGGDSCLALSTPQRCGSPGWSAEQIAALRAESLVGDGGHRSALVIDESARCYWWRNWRHEVRIAEVIGARRQVAEAQPGQGIGPGIDAVIARLFSDGDPNHDAAQREAVRRATTRLLILTGGPGTGKTRTALRLLLARQLLAVRPLRMALAAPTGKAAQRLNEAFQQGAAELSAQADPELDEALQQVLQQPAQTVHRLLGYAPSSRRFRYGRAQPLQLDVVLVDEVSMLDLDTLRALCEAIPSDALLVLMGDAEQLGSVASGSVLDDIVQALEAGPESPVVRLSHAFRSDAVLLPALQAARHGDVAALLAELDRELPALELHPVADARAIEPLVRHWAQQLVERIRSLVEGRGSETAARLLAAWQAQQLLCALREGRYGALDLAGRIDDALRHALGVPIEQVQFAGRSLMVLRNDYARGLFNGDLGVLLPDHDGVLRAWFAPSPGESAPRAFAPGDLPEHASAAALTVHKSQGSEYERIALLLPPQIDHALLDRQLVYTALSRARRGIHLWCSPAVLEAALRRRHARIGGLRDKLMKGTST